MNTPNPSEGFLLIVTYGRSGSTLLQRILQTIDGYSVKGENFNVLYPLFDAYDRAKEAKIQFGWNVKPQDRPWFGANEINPEALGKDLAESFVKNILSPPKNTRVVGFKEIRYPQVGAERLPKMLEFALEFLKPCRIIFNTRNLADVAQSKWMQSEKHAPLLAQLPSMDEAFHQFATLHPKESFVQSYENYKDDVNGLRPLFDFLQEPFNVEKLERVLEKKLTH